MFKMKIRHLFYINISTASSIADVSNENDCSQREKPMHEVQCWRSHFALSTKNAGSPGENLGTVSSKITSKARSHARTLIQEQCDANSRVRQNAREVEDKTPRLEAGVGADGETVMRQTGDSTLPIAIFNSVNLLTGIGMLALPLALKEAGWIIGLTLLALAAVATSYSAQLLMICLDSSTANSTYGDIAHQAFGRPGRNLVEFIFVLELLTTNVALVILFADSMHSIVPALSTLQWKVVLTMALMPVNAVSLKWLSLSSVLGISCCLGITLILVIDGSLTAKVPGSLRHVAQSYAWPHDWTVLPRSFGLFMAPWGGLPAFPAIFNDMRHPRKYGFVLRYTFLFTWSFDTTTAILGYLMFGNSVLDEVTQNLIQSKSHPHLCDILVVVLIAIIPMSKIPLTNKPIMDICNKRLDLDLRQMDATSRAASEASFRHRSIRAAFGALCNAVELAIAIAIPKFDRITALLGAALCFMTCVILPVAFRLRIFTGLSQRERIANWVLIVVAGLMGTSGVIWASLSPEKIHSIFHISH